jgi:signal transduction histidine kinase
MSEHRLFVHDLKNLLGIIIGYSALLLDEMPGDDSRRADIGEIHKAGEGALALLEDWNKAARGEAIK